MTRTGFGSILALSLLVLAGESAIANSESGDSLKLPAQPSATTRATLPEHTYPGTKDASGIERSFTPHTTVDCITRPWGGLNVQRSPGANMNTNFLLSSFTVTALPRFEVGTSPMLYGSKEHQNNFSGKLNFFRSNVQDWSLGYSRLQYGFSSSDFEEPSFLPETMRFTIQSLQLATNIHPTFTRFQLGLAFTQVRSVVEGSDWIKEQTAKKVNEYGVDLLYPVHHLVDFTVGIGVQRALGISAWEDVNLGLGSSLAWYRPKSIFSKPSIGFHYTPEKGVWQGLIACKLF